MRRLCAIAVVLLAYCGTSARADPIAVTSGFVTFTDEPGGFSFVGPGFALHGEWFPARVQGTFWYDRCRPCDPGTPVDFDTTTYGFSAADASYGSSSGRIGETIYRELFIDAALSFSGPRVVAPLQVDPEPFLPIAGPFTMAGHLFAYRDRARTAAPVFSTHLTGSGTAYVTFQPTTPLLLAELEYRFMDPAPVPEPSTFILMAIGLGAGGARLKRLRSARNDSA